jgi:putative phosphoribosyl transferase
LPLDIFLARKLGVPGHEELAFGAIAASGGRFLDNEVIEATRISHEQIEQITQREKKLLRERAALYRPGRPPLDIQAKRVILVDDGIATGASLFVAVNALRPMNPTELIVAVPVAPVATCNWLRREVAQLICLNEAGDFYAVGQFYRHFSQIEDDEVIALLEAASREAPRLDSV